jgi:hypothetical protein
MFQVLLMFMTFQHWATKSLFLFPPQKGIEASNGS